MQNINKKNIIGKIKKHKTGYNYLSILPFPQKEISIFNEKIIQKSNHAQFLLGQLAGITELLPDVNYFISSYIIKDATSSSQIEGTKATLVDAFEFKINPELNKESDADDILNYIKALNFGIQRFEKDDFPFSLRLIKEMHNVLMKDARATHFSDPGNFRKTQNWIGGTTPENASFVPPEPEEMIDALDDFEKSLHKDFVHPVIQAGLLHAQFETIHPFLDGNGRTGRLIITFFLLHKKLLNKPVLFLSSYFKKHQKTYYSKLQDYHSGDFESWVDFFLDGVIETSEQAIQLSKEITKLREQDMYAVSKIKNRNPDINIKILQSIYTSPVISSNTVTEWTGFTKQGTILYINKLISVGVLELYKKGEGSNPSVYIHRKYVNLFLKN